VKYWDATHAKTDKHSWRLPCYRCEMICHRSSLIRQSYHFEWDIDRVLLQLAESDTLSTLKTERAADIHYWNVWRVDEKVVQTLIRYYGPDLHGHLKSELKFKLLYWTTFVIYYNKNTQDVDWILICKPLNPVNFVNISVANPEISNFS